MSWMKARQGVKFRIELVSMPTPGVFHIIQEHVMWLDLAGQLEP